MWSSFSADTAHAQGRFSNVAEPQEGEEVKGDAGVAEIREVERGLSVSVDAGLNYYLGLGGISGLEQTFAPLNTEWVRPGTRLGMRVGYDVLNNLTVDGFLLTQLNKDPVNQVAKDNGFTSGDLLQLTPGVGARFSFITTDRLHVYGRGAAGLTFWFPREMLLTNKDPEESSALLGLMSVHLDGSVGIEYFTKLRHLSIGAEIAAQGLLFPFAVGFQVYPTIKYTF